MSDTYYNRKESSTVYFIDATIKNFTETIFVDTAFAALIILYTMRHTRVTAIKLHSQCYISIVLYWVHTNKASHDRWNEGVEKCIVMVPVC